MSQLLNSMSAHTRNIYLAKLVKIRRIQNNAFQFQVDPDMGVLE